MPAFSYAQAAKGLTSSPSDTKQNKPDTGVNTPEENVADRTAATATATAADQSSTQQSSELKNGPASVDEDVQVPAKTTVSERPSPSLGPSTTSTLAKEDEISITPNGTASESEWEKQSQVSTAAEKEKTSQAGDDDKAKSEASWENVTPPPKELKAAPLPPVNIWQQRQEAQEAKAKANALLKPAVTPVTTSKGSTPSSTPQSSGDVRSEHYGKGGNRKKASEATANATDASANGRDKKKSSDGSRKSGVRSNRGAETGEALPPVNDASSWPTPQIAQGEDLRKSQEQTDKPEKVEKEKHSGSRAHGKEKWMPVPYVPTAVFNTPLPPAARRGGRSARGSTREGGSRGAGHTGGDRTTPTSGSKASSAGDREKSDVPETQKGAASDASLKNGDVTEKHSSAATNSVSTEAQKDAKSTQDSSSNTPAAANTSEGNTQHSHPTSSQSPTRARQESKSYHKSHESSNTSAFKGAEQHGTNASRQVSSSTDAAHAGHARYGVSHDRRFEMGSRSGEFFKDSSFPPRDREFVKDREFTRDGRDYQRSEYSTRERESRPERGRGGYRGGRGGHSTYTSATTSTQNPSYHSAPISQHPFPPTKNFNFTERHRLQPSTNGSQPPQPQHSSSNNRMNMRSPSMPNPGMFAAAPYAIQTDLNVMYPYPQTAAPQGPMTAMPYQPYMENFSLMSMISMQLEYYFSVDNLCKDLFLRKHMDSQGFVLLSVIASFKRIKSLTEDIELLRFVCRQLRNVEYRPSDDGVDRLRKREGWQQWVLGMDMRDSSAQNDGPLIASAEEYVPMASAPPHMNGNGTYNSFIPTADLVSAEEAPKRQAKLSSAAPEFSPLASNGAGSFEPTTFTDGQVDNFVAVVR
ncbi:La domain family protein [Arthroderma uncinatum]|uniref:La domain family protein n=1 Tax=Arthroderma uncinatum TaxID=74035 RepID=UPI00144AA907|nr:La domain family protein [Arthroderma uncinatum]KAF3481483.1 La domain family protein [Arthroderma uncinatum]